MKTIKTYTFTYKDKDGNPHMTSIEANGTTNAFNSAMMDTRFKGCTILKTTFRRTDTAKGAQRAGGLDANGKQVTAKTHKEQLKAEFFNEFLVHLNLAIENLYNCEMENNAAVLSMDIKSLYNEFRNDNPFM
jgi:hypothetical protein